MATMSYRIGSFLLVFLLASTHAVAQSASPDATTDGTPPLPYGLYHLYESAAEATDFGCEATEDFMALFDDGVIVLGCDHGYYRVDGSTLEMETW